MSNDKPESTPEERAGKIPLKRLVMQNKVFVGDVIEPLNLSDDEKKELVAKVADAVEKIMMADIKRMLYGSEAPQKWTSFPPEKQGNGFGITICCA